MRLRTPKRRDQAVQDAIKRRTNQKELVQSPELFLEHPHEDAPVPDCPSEPEQDKVSSQADNVAAATTVDPQVPDGNAPTWDAKTSKLLFKGEITTGITEPTAANAGQWFAVPREKIAEFEKAFGIQSSSNKPR